MSIKVTLVLLIGLFSANAWAICEQNVDRIESYYINGMFTVEAACEFNTAALESFIASHLLQEGFSPTIQGTNNKSEFVLFQLIKAAKQKWEDDDAAV